MATINAAPRPVLEGIQDMSGRLLAIEPDMIPTHAPLLYFFAKKGDTRPNLLVGDGLIRMYGAESFNLRSAYATHQTVLVNEVNAAGNRFFAQRVIPKDAAPRATLQLWLDLLPTQVVRYQRNSDGSIMTDANGIPLPELGADELPVKVAGYVGKWVTTEAPKVNAMGEIITPAMIAEAADNPEIDIVPAANAMGISAPMQGDQVDPETSTISTRYPIMELEVSHIGSAGSLLGLRLSASHARSPVPGNIDLALEQGSFLYRLQCVERASENSTPIIIETKTGGQDVVFSFKEGAINEATGVDLFYEQNLLQSYSDFDSDPTPTYGPFGRLHVYDEYLQDVSKLIQASEADVDMDVSPDDGDEYLMNLVSAENLEGHPYHSFKLVGASAGGVLLNPYATHYAIGGSDGTMTFETFDALVAEQLENFGDMEANLLDSAKYPLSAVYDTGFTLPTKLKFFVPMGRRKDIAAFVSTQDVSKPQNTAEEESSILIALRTAARLYPESEIYGTSTCRAFIIGQSGYLINSQYRGLLPMVVELGAKLARYMGAGNGIWDAGQAIDKSPNNQITMFRDLNITFKPNSVYARDWQNGLVWAQSYSRRADFIPAFRSVYDDETSILVSGINVLIACNLQRVAEEVWRDMVGDATLTNDQFIERSDQLIERKVRNRYDKRVVIRPETYFTEEDTNNGFSNRCRIHMYGNNMKTMTTFTVVAHRREDLA